jgi:hypothetical protein
MQVQAQSNGKMRREAKQRSNREGNAPTNGIP